MKAATKIGSGKSVGMGMIMGSRGTEAKMKVGASTKTDDREVQVIRCLVCRDPQSWLVVHAIPKK